MAYLNYLITLGTGQMEVILVAGKVTVGLALHWSYVTDSVVY